MNLWCLLLGHRWDLLKYYETTRSYPKVSKVVHSTNRCTRCGKFHERRDVIK